MKSTGNILIAAIPILVSFFMAALFILDVARTQYYGQKAQGMADVALVSSLRLKAEALTRIAERWKEFGEFFKEADKNHVKVHSSHVLFIQNKAERLRRSISGYKGRIKAVVKVVAEANRVKRESVVLADFGGAELGVEPQNILAITETGQKVLIFNAWYKNNWPAVQKSLYKVFFDFKPLLKVTDQKWKLIRPAKAEFIWDVDKKDAHIKKEGNQGFPKVWSEALVGNKVQPFRYPFYRAKLKRAKSD